jgi:hypothetical protein
VGTLVELNPTPSTEPVSWQGCDALQDGRICEIALSADRTVTATFTP